MNKRNKKIIILSLFLAFLTISGLIVKPGIFSVKAQEGAFHPRLLFTEEEILSLREKISDSLGDDDAAYNRLINRADTIVGYSSPNSWIGLEYGFINIPLLGTAYQLSSQSNANKYEYRDKCKQAVLYLANNYDNSQDPHACSQRIFAMSLGFDMCFDGASQEEKNIMVNEMQSLLTYISDRGDWPIWDWEAKKYRPYVNNGGVMSGSAVGLASIVFRGEGIDDTLLDKALAWSEAVININLNSIFGTDGAFNEGVLYAGFAMRFFAPYVEARKKYDGYDYSTLPQLSEMSNWLAYNIRPNSWSQINNLNDALWTTYPLSLYNGIMDWPQYRYNSSLAKWLWDKEASQGRNLWLSYIDNVATVLWSQDIEPADPNQILPNSKLFSHRGLYYYRTGWPRVNQTETNDSVFSLYAGKFYGGHAQEDQGNFTLWSKGEDFVVDSGYGAGDWQDHNTIAIDDVGQNNAGSSLGTDGNIANHLINPFSDYLQADLSPAYNGHSEFNADGYPFPAECPDCNLGYSDWSGWRCEPNTVEKANRYVLAVKKSEVGEYFVVFDDIKKDANSHKYDWLLHSTLNNTIDTSQNPITITGKYKGNKLDIYFANPDFSNLSLSQGVYDTGNKDGDNQRLVVTNNTVNPQFFTIMYPYLANSDSPDFTNLPVNNGYGVKLTWDNNIDDYLFYTNNNISYDNIVSNGKFTLVRKNNNTLSKFGLYQGNSLLVNDIDLVQTNAESISVASDGSTVTISDALAESIIYGPYVTSVLDNENNSIDFERYQNNIYINTEVPADETPPDNINDLNAT
ncbi:MAG: heparinase II/III family protein [Patescibacteria group bacterium]|nr:heparinase II/III family protein [Patescibacteria group bacterium]